MHETGAIPFRVRVGVTGHRKLPSDRALEERVRLALARIRALTPARTPVRLAVVSPLAEGADQLVARIALEDDPDALEALLPLSEAAYVRTFETEKPRSAFYELLARATNVVRLDGDPTKPEDAYQQAGRRVVDACDVVLALWDGHPARGLAGTADVVAYARMKSTPVLLIETKAPFELREELGVGIYGESYRELDRYNTAPLPKNASYKTSERRETLLDTAADTGLDRAYVLELCDWILPFYARADALADQTHRWYRLVSNIVFFAAAGAVVWVAAQVLFWPDRAWLGAFEVSLLAMALLALALGRGRKVHARWICCRVLAERFRSAFFLALAGAEANLESPIEQVGLGPIGEWSRRAFDEVWKSRMKGLRTSSHPDAVKRFIMRTLIDEQVGYHQDAAIRYRRRARQFAFGSYVLFSMTFLAAALHTFKIGGHKVGGGLGVGSALSFLAIGLPALAGGLAGIEAQRQYQRNGERSDGMVHRLELARREMARAPDLPAVRTVVQETENILLKESEDWLVAVRFQGIKLAV